LTDPPDATPPDTTPLDPDEAAGLKLGWVATRGDLNAAEAQNIADAVSWAATRRFPSEQVLDEVFLRQLHRRMFGDVWAWAGKLRNSAKNIGVDPFHISVEVRVLVDNVRFWIAASTSPRWSADEIGARFHHRLVWIHPFPNGNGRHGRMATDLLLRSLDVEPFSWGSERTDDAGEVRSSYISALRSADSDDYRALIEFVRS
jgi:Fic-DOC domain mobile mystery protein B